MMEVEQIYTGCLAQGAYYITSNGEAAIIDPLREIQPYLKRLEEDGVQLKYIFETHFHADFVSGHLDLAKVTGATIVYGPLAETNFECKVAKDNERFAIGNVSLELLHTPGHTMESSCLLLRDENGKQKALFSGDTLFLGDVGRPDLAQKATHLTQEELAGFLYNSLQEKIMPLDDEILVYPAHGAGSACGKNMIDATVDSLGNQKKTNYALNQPNKEAFIEAVTEGLLPPPAYFGAMVQMNKNGYKNIEKVLETGLKPLSPQTFELLANETGAVILDTRSNNDFWKGFIPNSINIGIDGGFAPWVGDMIKDTKQPILLVTDAGREKETVTRLSRVGFDNVLGYLEGGFSTWKKEERDVDTVNRISCEEFAKQVAEKQETIIDVRKIREYETLHVEKSSFRPLTEINSWMGDLDPNEHFYLHCAGGYRSMIAASILQSRGIRNFTEIEGGMNAIAQTDVACG